MPLLLFIGIGAMIDFGPLLSNPKLFLFGAAAQFGIFAAIVVACFLGFDLKDAASIGIIGAADGPTSILVSQVLGSNYIGLSLWWHIPTWRLFLLSSLWSSSFLQQKKNAASIWNTNRLQFPKSKDHFPDRCYFYRRPCSSDVRFSGRIPDVRQPAPRVRRAEQPFRYRTERTVQSGIPSSGYYHCIQYEADTFVNKETLLLC